MWKEEEMAEVIDNFKKEDRKQAQDEGCLYPLVQAYLEKELAKNNFYKICIKEILKSLLVIGIDITIFLIEPTKIVSIPIILFFTGSFISSEVDVKRYLEIEATSYYQNNKNFMNMSRRYFEMKSIQKEKEDPQKYILHTPKIEEKSRKKDLKELYELKVQMLNSYVNETNKQKRM